MSSRAFAFHNPIAFWLGCAALIAGVLSHVPMFIHASHMGYRMVDMPLDKTMMVGMVMIPAGLLLAFYGLTPRLPRLRDRAKRGRPYFHAANDPALNRRHWELVVVLLIALIVDVMKPATLGFVMPGMMKEYEITSQTVGFIALVALIGTAVGSVLWGRLADLFGRRTTILLSALLFIGTAVCGAMPSFGANLVMCFLMGASAGGLLPIVFALTAEVIPTRHRGWLLVALGGIGTSAGYLIAAAAAAVLEPLFSWRALWLLGLPTGVLIIFLNRFIPESPRFLAVNGLEDQARKVLAKFAGVIAFDRSTEEPQNDLIRPKDRGWESVSRTHSRITWGLLACGLSWGLVTFGFVLWLPTNLHRMGMDAGAASGLLARSALLALPGVVLVVWLYHSWSSIKALILFIGLTTASLLAFFLMDVVGIGSTAAIIGATASLLVSSGGSIAMLIPYAAEIYPVGLRGTGSGMVAASSKCGGILGALCGVIGMFNSLAFSALFIAVPMTISAIILFRSGIDTRGRHLEEIQDALLSRDKTRRDGNASTPVRISE